MLTPFVLESARVRLEPLAPGHAAPLAAAAADGVWAGFGVLGAFTAAALGLAAWRLCRRDA